MSNNTKGTSLHKTISEFLIIKSQKRATGRMETRLETRTMMLDRFPSSGTYQKRSWTHGEECWPSLRATGRMEQA